MEWHDWLLGPFRVFSLGARIGLRITIGIVGFLLMGGGILAIDFIGWAIGLPILIVGGILTLKAFL